MKISKILAGAAGAGALFLVGAMTAFAIGSNGSFETGTASTPFSDLNAGDTSITGWTINSGSVDYINGYWPASDGSRSIDLNGLSTGAISQTFSTIAGNVYKVTFDLSGNPDSRSDPQDPYWSPSNKQVEVTVDGTQGQTYSYDTSTMLNSLSDMKWEGESYTFTAGSTSTTLKFASQTPGAFGPAIDNVDIESTPTVTASVNGGGHLLQQVNPGDKRKDWHDVSFVGYVDRMSDNTLVADWEVNFHNVSDPDLNRTSFHGNDVAALNLYPGNNTSCNDAVNFTVNGTWNGQPGYKIIFRAGDFGSPNTKDTVRISLYNGSSLVYDTHTADFGDQSDCVGTARTGLDTGNITIMQ